jgi:hypothetical protein
VIMETAIFLLLLGVILIVCSKIPMMLKMINLSVELFIFKPFTKKEIRDGGILCIQISIIIIAWICINKEFEAL